MNTLKTWLFTAMTVGMTSVAFAGDAATPESSNSMNGDIPSPEMESASEQQFSNDELQKFADVQEDIRDIQVEYTEKIDKAAETGDKVALQKEANAEITEKIEDHGLAIDQYSTIALAAQSNPALREKIQSMMN